VPAAPAPAVYLIAAGEPAQRAAPRIAEALRDALPGRGVIQNLGGGNIGTQFRRADRSGALFAVVLGEAELERGVAAVKPLRREGGQSECPLEELPARVAAFVQEG
jgi:histidyl-tRNA synthetase